VWKTNLLLKDASSRDTTRGADPVKGSKTDALASKASATRHHDTLSREATSDHG
jgi:hypothetical protein